LLHAAASSLVKDFASEFPASAKELRILPGIGAYTSAAIASLAFGERIPVVDGNVKRVVARFMALELGADDPKLERAAREQGNRWMSELPDGNLAAAGELNEALMELGATLCTPRNPRCGECPVAESCAALKQGKVLELPLPKKVKKWVDLEMVFLVQRVGARVLLKARQDGWSPGLYEPPSLILKDQPPESAATRLQHDFQLPTKIVPKDCGVVRHTITHHRIRAHVFLAPSGPTVHREDCLDPESVPLTGLARKVLDSAFP